MVSHRKVARTDALSHATTLNGRFNVVVSAPQIYSAVRARVFESGFNLRHSSRFLCRDCGPIRAGHTLIYVSLFITRMTIKYHVNVQ